MLYEKIDSRLSKDDEKGVIDLLHLIPENEQGNIGCILEISIYRNKKDLFNHIVENYNLQKINVPNEAFYDAVFNRDFSDLNEFEYFTCSLHKKSVDIYAQNSNKETFIENIIFSENENKYQMLDILIKNNIEIRSNPYKDRTLLVRTMPYKNLFKYLYDNCPNLVREKSKKNNSFFITAIQNKKHDLVRNIIDRNIIDINETGYANCSPLMFAVLNQDKEMFEILLSAGAKTDIQNNKGLDIFSIQNSLYTGFVSKRQNGKAIQEFNDYILSLNHNKRNLKFK
ncbi:ankyrin repeat domain-containing protein [Shigella flexneri]